MTKWLSFTTTLKNQFSEWSFTRRHHFVTSSTSADNLASTIDDNANQHLMTQKGASNTQLIVGTTLFGLLGLMTDKRINQEFFNSDIAQFHLFEQKLRRWPCKKLFFSCSFVKKNTIRGRKGICEKKTLQVTSIIWRYHYRGRRVIIQWRS